MSRSSNTFESILAKEGLSDWNVEQTSNDAYCWRTKKLITLAPRHGMAMFLHEVAHALIDAIEGDQHNGVWADKFTHLVDKYVCDEVAGLQAEILDVAAKQLRELGVVEQWPEESRQNSDFEKCAMTLEAEAARLRCGG